MSTNSSTSFFPYASQSCCGNMTVCHSITHFIRGSRLFLLLPSSFYILYLGYKQWRPQRSFQTASHSDIFTYNVVLLELTWTLGLVLFYGGIYCDLLQVQIVGHLLKGIIVSGETLTHALTCVDRYLAVVHPVTYRQLRGGHGVIIRNVSIVCVWLTSSLWSYFSQVYLSTLPIVPFFCIFLSSLIVVSFCSISVLCSLFRPRPGAQGGDKWHIDHTKQRPFFTVMTITGVLCFWMLGLSVAYTLKELKLLGGGASCMLHKAIVCFSLPSSLVLPLLYLHKAGKLPSCCCKRA